MNEIDKMPTKKKISACGAENDTDALSTSCNCGNVLQ